LFRPCTGCHTVGEGEPHLVGPNLHGIFDREFGSQGGYEYSDALRDSDLAVTDETLNRWLSDSTGLVPGSNMLFPALRTQEERDAIIAHLRRVTQ
jgi:cytochrome c